MTDEPMSFDKLDAYIKGYNAGRDYERKLILRLAKEASVHLEEKEYVYLQDLIDYLEEEDAKKNSQSKN